jgi:hypothetical protein
MGVAEEWAMANDPVDCFNPESNNKKKPNPNAGKFNPTLANCNVPVALLDGCTSSGSGYNAKLNTCPVVLRPGVPVEPLVLRANAGDCIDVTLRNKLVNEQAVVTASGEKVFYADGNPVFADLGKNLDWFLADLVTPVARAAVTVDLPPDLAGWQDMMWGVTRRIQPALDPDNNPLPPVNDEMHFFNNNLVRPGSYAGIHPQLVEYDASRDDGVAVGKNQPQLAAPGGTATARYYAGHLEYVPDPSARKNRRGFRIEPTPIEFGGSNLLSADRIKQPQKGLFGALVIEPEGAKIRNSNGDEIVTMADFDDVPDGQGMGDVTRKTRAQVTVDAGTLGPAGNNGTYREAIAVTHKITNLRWKDGHAVKNIHQEELGIEGAEDSGHAGYNYGMEPSWFRFKLPPNAPFGAGKKAVNPQTGVLEPVNDGSFGAIPNQQAFYSNKLVENEPNAIEEITGVSAAGDPQTPVFRAPVAGATAGATRMHVLNGASADRDSTFILHGHLWQRDPYVCPGEDRLGPGLPGLCALDSVGSLALGNNPIGKYMGGEEGMGHVYGHWPILFDAGGTGNVTGDYLFRDYTPSGNRNGMFGILRVE